MFKSKGFNVLAVIGLVLLLAIAGHFGLVAHADTGMVMMGVGGVLTNAGARIVDPILTNVAQGYRNAEFVGGLLFPRVPVFVSGGQIIEFGKEAFRKYNLRRTPGGATKRIQFGYLGKPFALFQDSLEIPVPREHMRDASIVPGIDLGSRATNMGMKVLSKSLEEEQAALATDASKYDSNHKVALTSTAKWSVDTGKPTNDIKDAREAIRSSVGVYPNIALMSAVAFEAAINNANVKDQFKYTTPDSITEEMLAKLWKLDKIVVGKGITMSDADVTSDIWGNNVVLAYANLGSINAEEPSYGYTYALEGNPLVEPTYWDNSTKSWVYPVNYERSPVLSGITAGFLIQTPN
jgi:hypothetical protein